MLTKDWANIFWINAACKKILTAITSKSETHNLYWRENFSSDIILDINITFSLLLEKIYLNKLVRET